MSFIGESRETINSSWHFYVCLTKEDCMMIQKALDKIVERRQKKYEKYRDIHEGGEIWH